MKLGLGLGLPGALSKQTARVRPRVNDIGLPGADGFGQGICPSMPEAFLPLPGCTDRLSANYGNYQYTDGSIMVWVPAFYMRLGHANNPTFLVHGVNSISIKPLSAYPDGATANADGYYLHRAFINAGANQLGFFRDKYDCSANGVIASSIKNAIPMVSSPRIGQVGFSAVTGGVDTLAGSIPAAKSRGAEFFPESVFIADALTRISEAHAQAATSDTSCAWYDPSGVRNYPKGNDNNALKSEADVTLNGAGAVSFTSAGASSYPNMALTGSGSVFARTTHNGQACGISDVAGNIYKINPGMTCIATSHTITAASNTNPVSLTIVGHGRSSGDVAMVTGVGGMAQLNNKLFAITVVDVDTISLDGVDGIGFGAYTSGGTLTTGTFYSLKPSVDIATVTHGNTLSTDHWGATGVAAQFDPIALNFATTYPNNVFAQRFGNGANAVFGWDSAAQRLCSMLGMPAAAGVSPAGSNLMGADYRYQYIHSEMCVVSRGNWLVGDDAGVRSRHLGYTRTTAFLSAGFACAAYLP